MRQEPRPAVPVEKQLGFVLNLCGVESLEISKVVQTVLVRLMEFKYGTGLLALCGEGLEKGQ